VCYHFGSGAIELATVPFIRRQGPFFVKRASAFWRFIGETKLKSLSVTTFNIRCGVGGTQIQAGGSVAEPLVLEGGSGL
jgi:hypothetical protein